MNIKFGRMVTLPMRGIPPNIYTPTYIGRTDSKNPMQRETFAIWGKIRSKNESKNKNKLLVIKTLQLAVISYRRYKFRIFVPKGAKIKWNKMNVPKNWRS